MTGPFPGRRLRHARWQTVLAVAAIAAAVTLPVILVGVGGGVAAHELHDLEDSGYQIVVSAAGLHGLEDAHADAAKILGVPGVAAAAPILGVSVDIFNASGNASALLAEGVVPYQFAPTLGPTESGLFPIPLPLGDPNDTVHYANGTYAGPATNDILLSSTYASRHDVPLGSTVRLSPSSNASLAVAFNVTGFFGTPFSLVQPAGAYAALLPLSDLQVLTGYASGPGTVVPDAADTIEIVVTPSASTDPSTLAAIAGEVHALLPSYTVTTLQQEAQQLAAADGVLTGFYLALSSVGLGVGLLFLALVLVRRVERDRRSIGIRRALGLPRRTIALGIVADGVVLAAAGGAAGVASGIVVVRALGAWASPTVREAAQLAVFSPGFLIELVAGVVALAAAASLAAARAAGRVDLLEALR